MTGPRAAGRVPSIGRLILKLLLLSLAVTVTVPAAAQAWVSARAEGRLAFAEFTESDSHIWTINPDGSNERQLTFGAEEQDSAPAFSPSGATLAFTHTAFSSTLASLPSEHIDLVSSTGGRVTDLTPRSKSLNFDAAWSPGGSSIIFVRTGFGTSNIWSMRPDGSDPTQLTTLPDGSMAETPTFSPDGSHIVFATDAPGLGGGFTQISLVEMTASGGDLHVVVPNTLGPEEDPDWHTRPSRSGDLLNELIFQATPVRPTGTLHPPQIEISEGSADGFDAPPTLYPAGSGPVLGTSPRWSPVQPTLGHPDRFAYITANGNDLRLYPGAQPVTDDPGSAKFTLAWGPAPRFSIYDTGALSVIRPIVPDANHVRLFVSCPTDAGRHGCGDLIGFSSAGRSLTARHLHLRAGAHSIVALNFTRKLAGYITPTANLRLTLRQIARGHTFQRRDLIGHARLSSSVTQSCPSSAVAGSTFGFAGSLRLGQRAQAARAGMASLAPGSRKTLVVVAQTPDGELRAVRTRTNGDGRYSLTSVLAEPGIWTLYTVWGGNSSHSGEHSAECSVDVGAPPIGTPTPTPTPTPAPKLTETSLTLACPSKATVKDTRTITGAISPAFAGASINVSYTYPQGSSNQTATHTVTTDSSGGFSDSITYNAAANWSTQAGFAGDSAHKASQSSMCPTTVEP